MGRPNKHVAIPTGDRARTQTVRTDCLCLARAKTSGLGRPTYPSAKGQT